jgi:hypothetical protein
MDFVCFRAGDIMDRRAEGTEWVCVNWMLLVLEGLYSSTGLGYEVKNVFH